MNNHPYSCNYQSPERSLAAFPSLRFYTKMAGILYRAGRKASPGPYTSDDWIEDSEEVGAAMESVGTSIRIEGFEHIQSLTGPCVFVANHMSTLETFFLPCVIQPVRDVTFVVKGSLLKYPCLGPVLAARDPIVVGRVNPREDLAAVLDGGQKHLAAGRSIIIFPQGTRSAVVDEEQFSSLGIKLARKANVPVLPVALRTDAWGTGSLIKDIGWIRPDIPIRFRFGEPLAISGNGRAEHTATVGFIKQCVESWIHEVPAS